MPRSVLQADEAERALLGAAMGAGSPGILATAGDLRPEHFTDRRHSAAWAALQRLEGGGSELDLVILKAELDRAGELGIAGGGVYLAALLDGVPRHSSLAGWADLVREGARRRRIRTVGAQLVELADNGADPQRVRQVLEQMQVASSGSGNRLVALTAVELLTHQFPARPALLCRDTTAVFRSGHIGEVYAVRGVGKTWFLQTIALVAATGCEVLGFRAPEPCRVLFVDGEMSAEELQDRLRRLCTLMRVDPPANLVTIGADWQDRFLPRLDTSEGQALLEPFVSEADLVILDNRSCLFDPEGEKDPGAWQPAQEWLLRLRREGKGVLLAHHSNRQGGARGISKPEDVMNLLLKLTRPEGYVQDQGARFLVEFDKARGVHGPAAAPFIATLTTDGWKAQAPAATEGVTMEQRILEQLRTCASLGESPKTASKAVEGAGNRQAALKAFAGLVARGAVSKGPDGYRVASSSGSDEFRNHTEPPEPGSRFHTLAGTAEPEELARPVRGADGRAVASRSKVPRFHTVGGTGTGSAKRKTKKGAH